jgi:hypothetical protein
MRRAHGTDASTGRELKPEPALSFVDFEQLLDRI